MNTESAYRDAGVDIDRKMEMIKKVLPLIESTRTSGVIKNTKIFAGVYKYKGYRDYLLASVDGVGTKIKVAVMAGKHEGIGEDIVNHCTNDILVHGANPIFFLDYIAFSRIEPEVFNQIIKGICKACKENKCALLGGETAEMPGVYPEREYDLVGTIVGSVSRDRLVTGKDIKKGDIIIGLKSTGLHTNGYSLARKVIFDVMRLKINDVIPEINKSVADVLLAPHRSYLKPVNTLRRVLNITGMAHVTGGGFIDNIPRVLPRGVDALIRCGSWHVPEIFRIIQKHGNVSDEEMYHVFNMGIGFVIFIRRKDRDIAIKLLTRIGEEPLMIGEVKAGRGNVILE